MPQKTEKWVSAGELAAILGTTDRTVRRNAEAGSITRRPIGNGRWEYLVPAQSAVEKQPRPSAEAISSNAIAVAQAPAYAREHADKDIVL